MRVTRERQRDAIRDPREDVRLMGEQNDGIGAGDLRERRRQVVDTTEAAGRETMGDLVAETGEPETLYPATEQHRLIFQNGDTRLRERAAYPQGRAATGAEAYAAYGRDSGPVFKRVGGHIAWRGAFELMLIGPREERWDHCFIARYPSVAAFVEMIRDPVYREAVKHRQAAVEDSRLIRLKPLPAGKTFGEIPDGK